MLLTTELKTTLTNYTKSDIITKRLMLLPVDLDKNGLLFRKQFHMMKKITG